ncbi:hypothetical protein X841_11755 [Streptococcus thermophilus M17PTZA496]|uniref:Uncharacterized protein n=1 Tax=Streptococcus thermophilus M17PTZA496 TaxID=1433289 RepID=A0A0E2PYF5_STRTR|nr:hypothetical protein X841_11755 [Streptococcus thermophilus M17PTZA496]
MTPPKQMPSPIIPTAKPAYPGTNARTASAKVITVKII